MYFFLYYFDILKTKPLNRKKIISRLFNDENNLGVSWWTACLRCWIWIHNVLCSSPAGAFGCMSSLLPFPSHFLSIIKTKVVRIIYCSASSFCVKFSSNHEACSGSECFETMWQWKNLGLKPPFHTSCFLFDLKCVWAYLKNIQEQLQYHSTTKWKKQQKKATKNALCEIGEKWKVCWFHWFDSLKLCRGIKTDTSGWLTKEVYKWKSRNAFDQCGAIA